MNDTFYSVTFSADCSTYYFHNLERARAFVLEAYDDELADDATYNPQAAAKELNQWNSIEDYAWIEFCGFEDKED